MAAGETVVSSGCQLELKAQSRIVEFRAAHGGTAIVSRRQKHFAIGQQRRPVEVASSSQATRAPGFKVGSNNCELLRATSGSVSPRDQHVAIGQERRHVPATPNVRAVALLRFQSRDVELRVARETAAIISPRDQDLAIGQ